jgi:hypothetical protein
MHSCPWPQAEETQGVPVTGGSAQVPHGAVLVPEQKPLEHCALNAQTDPFDLGPGGAQGAGGLLSKKSEQE